MKNHEWTEEENIEHKILITEIGKDGVIDYQQYEQEKVGICMSDIKDIET